MNEYRKRPERPPKKAPKTKNPTLSSLTAPYPHPRPTIQHNTKRIHSTVMLVLIPANPNKMTNNATATPTKVKIKMVTLKNWKPINKAKKPMIKKAAANTALYSAKKAK